MAVAAITTDIVDVLLNPTSPTTIGSGNAAASETVINLQGSSCAAVGHAGSLGSTNPTSINQFRGMSVSVGSLVRTGIHLHVWIRDLYPIRNKNIGGVSLYLQGGSQGLYYASGIDTGYAGGWFHFVINLDPTTRPPIDLDTLPSGNITRVGYCGNISATKGESFLQNSYLDAIRSNSATQGVYFSGGLTGDRLTFVDCAQVDGNLYGYFRNLGGALFCEGSLNFGTLNLNTWLTDSIQTIGFSNFTTGDGVTSSVAPTYYKISFSALGTGVVSVTLTDITWKGVSRNTPFSFMAAAFGTGGFFSSTRSTYIFGGTLTFGAGYTSLGDSFTECAFLDVAVTLTNPVFTNSDRVDLLLAGAVINGGSTNLHNTLTGIHFVETDDITKISNHNFDNTGGVGHAVRITAIGTQNLINVNFTGYGVGNDAAVFNDSGGLITLNLSGGNSPTVRNGVGASTVIVVSYTLTLTDLVAGMDVTIVNSTTRAELFHEVLVGTSTTFAHDASQTVDILLNSLAYDPNLSDIYDFVLPSNDSSIKFQLIDDPNYSNPA